MDSAAHAFHKGFDRFNVLISACNVLSVHTQFLAAELSDPIATCDQHRPHAVVTPASEAILMPNSGDA